MNDAIKQDSNDDTELMEIHEKAKNESIIKVY